MKRWITGGKVWSNNQLNNMDIEISDDGLIKSLISSTDNHYLDSLENQDIINASGKFIFPGGIDLHAHIQDGAETFFAGSCAAAAGGITTVIDMPPFHTSISKNSCKKRREWAEQECITDFGLTGGIVVDISDLESMDEVARFGAVQFKLFMLASPPTEVIWAAVKKAAETGLRLTVHMDLPACTTMNNINWDDPLGFPKAFPKVSENSATAMVLEMAKAAGAPIHVCHVSSERTIEIIDMYRHWGVDLTAETAPHYLLLNENEFLNQGDRVVATPPLRKKEDSEALWKALEEKIIDIIISDHFLGALPTPQKKRPHIKDAEPGIAGLELAFPLMYFAGVNNNKISLQCLVNIMSHRPAEISGIDYRKGHINIGHDADLIIFDPEKQWKISDPGHLTINKNGPLSRISTLPYENWTIKGKIDKTIIRGKTIWSDNIITAKQGWGTFIQRK